MIHILCKLNIRNMPRTNRRKVKQTTLTNAFYLEQIKHRLPCVWVSSCNEKVRTISYSRLYPVILFIQLPASLFLWGEQELCVGYFAKCRATGNSFYLPNILYENIREYISNKVRMPQKRAEKSGKKENKRVKLNKKWCLVSRAKTYIHFALYDGIWRK